MQNLPTRCGSPLIFVLPHFESKFLGGRERKKGGDGGRNPSAVPGAGPRGAPRRGGHPKVDVPPPPPSPFFEESFRPIHSFSSADLLVSHHYSLPPSRFEQLSALLGEVEEDPLDTAAEEDAVRGLQSECEVSVVGLAWCEQQMRGLVTVPVLC